MNEAILLLCCLNITRIRASCGNVLWTFSTSKGPLSAELDNRYLPVEKRKDPGTVSVPVNANYPGGIMPRPRDRASPQALGAEMKKKETSANRSCAIFSRVPEPSRRAVMSSGHLSIRGTSSEAFHIHRSNPPSSPLHGNALLFRTFAFEPTIVIVIQSVACFDFRKKLIYRASIFS